jgi:hypothetical protein
MNSQLAKLRCDWEEQVTAYLLCAPPNEVPALEDHLSTCSECRQTKDALAPIVDALVHWPTDVLHPRKPLWPRLAQRIAAETGTRTELPPTHPWSEPRWEEVAPGISCKLLATDADTHMVSMLVRLAPGVSYPAHSHAGVEELHLLHGELWINDEKLFPGDFNRAEPGTKDTRVFSETGCTCVLITSARDELF